MKKFHKLLLIALFMQGSVYAQWTTLGGESISEGQCSDMCFTFNNIGEPHVAYIEANDNLILKKFNGSTWENVGGNFVISGASNEVELDFDDDNVPYIALTYLHPEYPYNVTSVFKFNGTTWTDIGPNYDWEYNPDGYALAIFQNTPILSSRNSESPGCIVKYNGSNWIDMNMQCYAETMFETNDNYLYADVWNMDLMQGGVFKYNGADWILIGEANTFVSSIAATNESVFYSHKADNDRAIAFEYNSSLDTWEGLGGYISDDPVGTVLISADNNENPYVIYNQTPNYNATCKKFNGTDWELIGSTNFASSDIDFGNFEYNNGALFFSYCESSSNGGKLYVMKYELQTIINENTLNEFKIYPNPTNGIINIITNEQIEKITILDISGRIIIETTNSKIDLSEQQTGIYFVKIATENDIFTEKVIIE